MGSGTVPAPPSGASDAAPRGLGVGGHGVQGGNYLDAPQPSPRCPYPAAPTEGGSASAGVTRSRTRAPGSWEGGHLAPSGPAASVLQSQVKTEASASQAAGSSSARTRGRPGPEHQSSARLRGASPRAPLWNCSCRLPKEPVPTTCGDWGAGPPQGAGAASHPRPPPSLSPRTPGPPTRLWGAERGACRRPRPATAALRAGPGVCSAHWRLFGFRIKNRRDADCPIGCLWGLQTK